MRAFGFAKRLEPVGDLAKTFIPGGFGHARIHVGVFVGFAGNGRFEVVRGAANRKPGGRVADFFEVFKVPVGMPGFPFGGGAEYRGDVVIPFDVGFGGKIQVTTVRLGFPGKCGLSDFVRFSSRFKLMVTSPVKGL